MLREPLLHFVLLGAALFALWSFVEPASNAAAPPREIVISQGELAQLALQFQSQWRRAPTPDEMNGLIEGRIQEEILYREALALGLDENDTIVKRRLAQKMQFLAEDVAAAREPDAAELAAFFARNRERFAEPPRLSFRHRWFSPDRRGARAHDEAAQALQELAGEVQASKLADAVGDPFMFLEYYRDRAPEFLAKEFGPSFAQAVARLAPGAWQGPIESGFGWHLVFVDAVSPGRVPDFEEVEADVRSAWLADQKERSWKQAYEEMRAKYTVLLPAPE